VVQCFFIEEIYYGSKWRHTKCQCGKSVSMVHNFESVLYAVGINPECYDKNFYHYMQCEWLAAFSIIFAAVVRNASHKFSNVITPLTACAVQMKINVYHSAKYCDAACLSVCLHNSKTIFTKFVLHIFSAYSGAAVALTPCFLITLGVSLVVRVKRSSGV